MNESSEWIPSELFTKIVHVLPLCTVDFVPFDSSKKNILLFKRTKKPLKGTFFTSGGRLLKGEDLKDAATRQAKRELGLDIEPQKLVFGGILNEVFEDSEFGDESYHSVNIHWGYVLTGSEVITLDDQHSESKWFSLADKTLHPYIKTRIRNIMPKL